MDFPWKHQRRYNSYAEYFRQEFGTRVQKLTLDAGFTCPNRDGTAGTGGCTYCNNDAFNPSYCQPEKSITRQLKEGVGFHKVRYRRAVNYLAYFQAYSNTYAPLERLRALYEEALSFPGVIGLVIGTRPDCIDNEMLDYFSELNSRVYLVLEYGVESIYNNTLEKVNRGHSWEQSEEAIQKTAARGIRTGAHFILGLPGETREMMLNTAEVISSLPLHSIKLHQLQIIKDTRMAIDYQNDPSAFSFFTLNEYIELVIDFLERLNPAIVVERIAGEVPPRFLAGPGWGLIRNDQVLQRVENRIEERNTWQGKLC
ncbi:MAG: TIGR01212 family radical SAM protein [Bacteroidetes bacterium]|nr:TIGR01212 family radical SAM protein [Bacteroidota bacterium]